MVKSKEKIIGRVIASENKPTTSTNLQFWATDETILRPFDIIKVDHISKNDDIKSKTYAMITNLQYITDGSGYLSSYISNDFGEADIEPENIRIGTTIAEAEVLFNSDSIEMPLKEGEPVYWADADGIKSALGLDDFRKPIPAGFMTMSNGTNININFEGDFLIGKEGAHLNIAGISGLATKTSYAMFILNALQQKMEDDVSIVVFNVKGYDLLACDQNNEELSEKTKNEWDRCGLIPKPFDNVTYFYPYSDDPSNYYNQSRCPKEFKDIQSQNGNYYNYSYSVNEGIYKLELMFSDIDDPQATMESCVYEMIQMDKELSDWKSFKEEVTERSRKGSDKSNDIPTISWRKFNRILKMRLDNPFFTNMLQSKQSERRQIETSEILNKIKPGHVCVIDIEPLPDYLQCLVVGDIVQQILAAKLGDSDQDIDPETLGKVVIFADELNKYAPKGGNKGRSLTQTLLEITERGRSLGVVLFGAEQFRSGVHDRVLGNCSTSVFGRTNPVEIQKGQEYRLLSKPQQSSLTRLPKGTLMLQHPLFTASVIKAQFPEPTYKQPSN